MILVLVHEGLDVSADLELGEPGPGLAAVRHRGGDRLTVTARADRAAMEWSSTFQSDIVTLTVGPPASGNTLAWAVARASARAVRIWDDGFDALDLAAMARILSAAVRRIAPDLVLAGERGLAGATGALPALVAAHLGWSFVDGAVQLGDRTQDREIFDRRTLGPDLSAKRRLRGGRQEELAVALPAVVTVTADSIEPRYVSVRARREAARRGHEIWSLGDLGLTPDAVRGMVRTRVDRVDWPRPRPRRTAQAVPSAGPRSAADRLRQLVAGGAGAPRAGTATPAAAPTSRVVEGDPRVVADRILSFLEQQGFV